MRELGRRVAQLTAENERRRVEHLALVAKHEKLLGKAKGCLEDSLEGQERLQEELEALQQEKQALEDRVAELLAAQMRNDAWGGGQLASPTPDRQPLARQAGAAQRQSQGELEGGAAAGPSVSGDAPGQRRRGVSAQHSSEEPATGGLQQGQLRQPGGKGSGVDPGEWWVEAAVEGGPPSQPRPQQQGGRQLRQPPPGPQAPQAKGALPMEGVEQQVGSGSQMAPAVPQEAQHAKACPLPAAPQQAQQQHGQVPASPQHMLQPERAQTAILPAVASPGAGDADDVGSLIRAAKQRLDKEKQAAESKAAALQDQMAALQQQLDESKGVSLELSSEVAQLRSRLEESRAMAAQQAERAAEDSRAAEAEVAQLRQRLETAEDLAEVARAKLADMEQQVLLSEDGGETEFLALAVSDRKEAVKKLEKEQGMHTHTKAALKNAETQLRLATKAQDETNKRHQQDRKKWEQEVKTAKEATAQEADRVRRLTDRCATYDAQLKELRNLHERVKAELDQARLQAMQQQQSLMAAEAELASLRSRVTIAEEEQGTLAASLRKIKSQKNEVEVNYNLKEDELEQVRKELEEFKAKIAGVQMEAQLYRENARARAAVPQPAAEDPSATPADAGTVKAEEHHRVHSKMEWYRKMYDSQKIEISNFKQEISRLKEKVTLGRSPSSSKDKHSARAGRDPSISRHKGSSEQHNQQEQPIANLKGNPLLARYKAEQSAKAGSKNKSSSSKIKGRHETTCTAVHRCTPQLAVEWLLEFLDHHHRQLCQNQIQQQNDATVQQQKLDKHAQPNSIAYNILSLLPQSIGYPQIASWFEDFLLEDPRVPRNTRLVAACHKKYKEFMQRKLDGPTKFVHVLERADLTENQMIDLMEESIDLFMGLLAVSYETPLSSHEIMKETGGASQTVCTNNGEDLGINPWVFAWECEQGLYHTVFCSDG